MNRQILIIEDQAAMAEAMSRLLARHGLNAAVCGDGVEGLKKYAAEPYDLLIVDLHLPKLSGVEVIKKIRGTHRGKNLPVIIITGVYKGREYASRAQAALGVAYYLEKPFTQEAFLSAVKNSLGQDKPAAAGPEKATPTSPAPSEIKPHPETVPAAAPAVKITMLSPESPPREKADRAAVPAPVPSPPLTVVPPAPAVKPVAEIKPRPAGRGNLRDRPVDIILLEARRRGTSGILYLKKNNEECHVSFLNGLPFSLFFQDPEFSFGNFLFAQGKVSLMELQVYESGRKNLQADEELFVKMGCISPEEYFAEWRRYLTESLISLFCWTDGEFTFQILPSITPGTFLSVNFPDLIYQGYRLHLSSARLSVLRQKAHGRFLARTPAFYEHQMHLRLEPPVADFLDQINGSRRLEELLPPDPLLADQLLRALAAFFALEMVELRQRPAELEIMPPFHLRPRPSAKEKAEKPDSMPLSSAESPEPQAVESAPVPVEGETFEDIAGELEETLTGVVEEIQHEEPKAPPPPPNLQNQQQEMEKELLDFYRHIKDKTHYEILGLRPQEFDFTKMKENYFRLVKKFNPENFLASSGEVLGKAEEVLSRLATAYNTLANVVSKEKYDEMLALETRPEGMPGDKAQDKMHAEVAFQSGLAFMEMEDYEAAEKSLSEAVSLAPDNAEILAHYAYAVYHKNRKFKTAQKRVQELLSKALKLNPRCAPAFAYRGLLLLEDDRPALAEADFKKALGLNPRQLVALKGLRAVEQKRHGEKKGIFGKLLK